ncbi:MAG: LamG domain-containing protein [Planctomycetota bacterium]
MSSARSQPARRRGTVYVAVLGAMSVAGMLALAGLASARAERRAAVAALDVGDASLFARSGIELALEQMAEDPDWRSRPALALWDDGQRSVRVTASAVGGEALSTSPCDHVELLAECKVGEARQLLSVLVVPEAVEEASPVIIGLKPLGYWPFRDGHADAAIGFPDGTANSLVRFDDTKGTLCTGAATISDGAFIGIDHEDHLAVDQGTISLWFLPEETTTQQVLISKFGDSYADTDIEIGIQSGAIIMRVGTASQVGMPSSPIAELDWNHLAIVFQESGSRIYLNGEAIGAFSGFSTGVGKVRTDGMNTQPMTLGASMLGSSADTIDRIDHHFVGSLRDFAIFGYVLGPDEINELAADTPTIRRFTPVSATFSRRVDDSMN